MARTKKASRCIKCTNKVPPQAGKQKPKKNPKQEQPLRSLSTVDPDAKRRNLLKGTAALRDRGNTPSVLGMNKRAFERFVEDIARDDVETGFRLRPSAVRALRQASEDHLVGRLKEATTTD